ncbi:MAG: flagellar basal body L-ring protein FlgH, partial [Bdellovibrionales bacterium]|nr:flagellar basal body L-ring protein FlgH [Bdellovibrionales bacterium]
MMKKLLFLFMVLLMNQGCSSFGKQLKSWAAGESSSSAEPSVTQQSVGASGPISYSQVQEYKPFQKRQYKRVTKKTIEDQARVDSRAGSLWVNEGQGAYLFTENIVRMIGDTLVVQLEGEPEQQLRTKAKVIKDLLDKLESRRRLASQKEEKKDPKKKEDDKKQAKTVAPTKEADDPFKVKKVSTRIIERLVDGNYRIKGSQ